MNAMRTGLIVCLVCLACGAMASAGAERPYLGVRLDPERMPPLLTKHLALEAGQGIRIMNVNVGSPADRAGLERDDIIIGFKGKNVSDMEAFIEAVREAGTDAPVALEIIHLGQRKMLEIQLEPLVGDVEWKYPPEPESVTSWRPGKVFRIGPDGQDWIEIPFDKIPEFGLDVQRFFNERYVYEHAEDGEKFTIAIEGDPDNDQTKIIVREGQKELSTDVNHIDALPEKYREPAQDALENARRSTQREFRMRLQRLPRPKIDLYERRLEDVTIPRPNLDQWSEKKDRVIEKLQQQMELLQQRMKQLEEFHSQMREKLSNRPDKEPRELEGAEPPAPPPAGDKRPV